MARTRISITIPPSLVREADRAARRLGRSRSWVVVEALRRYLRRDTPGRSAHSAPAVREAPAPPYGQRATPLVSAEQEKGGPPGEAGAAAEAGAEVSAARTARLRTELRLTPLDRLRRAEELARLGRRHGPRGPRAVVVGFTSYEDFVLWKRARRIGLV